MSNSPASTTQAPNTVHRTVRLRLYPGDAVTGILLTAIARAVRKKMRPGPFPKQGAHGPVGHVQRNSVVVQPRRNIAGGIGVRVQPNPVHAVTPVPVTCALPHRSVRESICEVQAGLIKADAEIPASGYRSEGAGHHAVRPAAIRATTIPTVTVPAPTISGLGTRDCTGAHRGQGTDRGPSPAQLLQDCRQP